MKTSLFIANIVSAILLLTLAFSNPSITGAAITSADPKAFLSSPIAFANIFIIATIAFDIYFYMKSKKR